MGYFMINTMLDSYSFSTKSYKKNDIIKNKGDECNNIGYIISGDIKIINITLDNYEYIIDTLNEGCFFGDNLIYSTNNKYPGTIIACNNVIIKYFSRKNFNDLLQNNNDFLNYYLKYASNRYITLQTRIKVLCQPSIKDKFLYYLQMQSNISNSSYVYIKSIEQLANYLNVTRPSLSRCINDLIKKGIIKKNKKVFIIVKY